MITTELSQMTHKKRSLPHPLHPCTYLKAIGHVAVKPGKIESDILTKDLQIRLYSEKYVTYAPVLLSSNDEICAQFGRKGGDFTGIGCSEALFSDALKDS